MTDFAHDTENAKPRSSGWGRKRALTLEEGNAKAFAAERRMLAKENAPKKFRAKKRAIVYLTRKQWREVAPCIFERNGRRCEVKQVTRSNWYILDL